MKNQLILSAVIILALAGAVYGVDKAPPLPAAMGEIKYIIEKRDGGFVVKTNAMETTRGGGGTTNTLTEYFVAGNNFPAITVTGARKMKEMKLKM